MRWLNRIGDRRSASVDRRWTMDDGRWTMDDGRWTMDDGRWTMDDGRWTMDDGRWTLDDGRWTILAVCVFLVLVAGCSRTVAPPVVTTPRYPDYIFPTLSPPDPQQADLLKQHDAAWRWFQAGDLGRAESEFQAILKRSPQFYPSETALGYLELSRKNFESGDRALRSRAAVECRLRACSRRSRGGAVGARAGSRRAGRLRAGRKGRSADADDRAARGNAARPRAAGERRGRPQGRAGGIASMRRPDCTSRLSRPRPTARSSSAIWPTSRPGRGRPTRPSRAICA